MKRVLAWLAVPCLIVAVPVCWFGYQATNNWLAARGARAALHEAIPGNAHVVDEEVHPCDTDDDAAPPYCGTADVLVSGCLAGVTHEITAHGYEALASGPSGAEFVRGKDDIYLDVNASTSPSSCEMMIRYQRDPLPKTHLRPASPRDASTPVTSEVALLAPGLLNGVAGHVDPH